MKVTPGRGDGVFSTKSFSIGDIVMVGVIEKTLTANHSHASQVSASLHVQHAGLISKVNHSCNPSCGISVNASGAHDFIAFRVIEQGEEITFDYAMRNYSIDYFPDPCLCGEVTCRVRVNGWKGLSIKKRDEYEGFVAPYLLQMSDEICLAT
ncbi:SET domain-containing protein-lysine N-methyltransferase [Synechococcus sp. AH-224-I15]|nr:SET domain-containing protein-lysine N-methyltransferase [Synechococcus sp. AH-224-I15]